jgi:hypothetical protein
LTKVYVGIPDPSWLDYIGRPACVSVRRLYRKTTLGLPRADYPWFLDSGITWVFDYVRGSESDKEVSPYPVPAERYAELVHRYDVVIGNLEWASVQDYPAEAKVVERTGLSEVEHQRRSVASYLELSAIWEQRRQRGRSHRPNPFRPALQGGTDADSYLRCVDMYRRAGVDLTRGVVGLGGVCMRESTREITEVVEAVCVAVPGIKLHGYGVKTGGLELYGHHLHSIDSQAWSKAARARRIKSPRCTNFHTDCRNCAVQAQDWHDEMTARFPQHWTPAPTRSRSSHLRPIPAKSCASPTSPPTPTPTTPKDNP